MSDAAARSLGSLWGTAKFAGKSALGMAKMAAMAADASRPGNVVAQMQLGQAAASVPGETARFVKETPRRYQEALAKAGARTAQGDHFGAGDVFTEEFTAPVATAVVGAVEGGAAAARLGSRAVARYAARSGARDAGADAALVDSGVSEAHKTAVIKEARTGTAPAADPAVPPAGPPAPASRGYRYPDTAVSAKAELPRSMQRHAVATAGDARTISRMEKPAGYDSVPPEEVARTSREIGHPLTESGAADQGVPGQYLDLHAERQAAILRPGEPVEVTNPQCTDCQDWFQARAASRGAEEVVHDPEVTRVFNPDRSVEVHHPDGTIEVRQPTQ